MYTPSTACASDATAVFRARARSFWFAARFLPDSRRAAVAGVYVFARAIDDLVDEPSPTDTPERVLGVLHAWRDWLERPTLLIPPDRGVAQSVLPALVEYGVPAAYLQLLVDGVASDLGQRELRSWPEVRAYCMRVASSVGLVMCHLLGAGDDPLARQSAVELGIAMQLTNILRDLGADLQVGRLYVAGDHLAQHGYSRERLAWLAAQVAQRGPGAIDEPFRALMRSQIELARAHYARGLEGVWRLPDDCRLAILLAGRLYRAILDSIEAANYDVFSRRAATSTWLKMAEAVRSSVALRLPRQSAKLPARNGWPADDLSGVLDQLAMVGR